MKYQNFIIVLFLLVIIAAPVFAQEGSYMMMEVKATDGWANSGCYVNSGDQIFIVAKGQVNSSLNNPLKYHEWNGPDGRGDLTCPNSGNYIALGYPVFSLVGKINEQGTPFGIGSSFAFQANSTGYVYLAMNDDQFGDNGGSFIVTIFRDYIQQTDVGEMESDMLNAPQLSQNFPNPFNPSTTIQYKVHEQGHVIIYVYDVEGRLVKRLVDKAMSPGSYSVTWQGNNENGEKVTSGTYFYRIRIKGQAETKKAILIR